MKLKLPKPFVPPPPRITGLLHNCLLNCGLPTIFRGLEILANDEEGSAPILDESKSSLVLDSFNRLKSLFAKYYGFPDNETFGFFTFFKVLESYSFYALELLFLPILRQFVIQNCETGLDTHYLGEIQEDGSYNDLHYTEASQLYFQYFGIFIEIYEYHKDNPYRKISYSQQTFDDNLYPFKGRPKISIYFKDEHYELQPFENLASANQIFNQEIQELPVILQELHTNLSFSLSSSETIHALQNMRTKMTEVFNPTHSLVDEIFHDSISDATYLSITNGIIIGAEFLTFLSGVGIIIGALALVGLFSTIAAATIGAAVVSSSAITFSFSMATMAFFSFEQKQKKEDLEEFIEVDFSNDRSL